MSDHPTAESVKVSIGAKNPQKPSRKPFTFGLPNEMRLADIYNYIRNPPAEDHIDAIKELQEFVDQHQGTINELKLKKASFPPGGRLKPSDQKELDKLEKEITEQKQWLRCFCWSGIFDTSKGAPKNKDLKQHSGRLQIDIDWKDKPRIESEELRDRLGKDPHIEASLLSPTGRGVKCGILIPVCANEEEHKQAYFAAERYFKETYKIKVDPANKDVRRVCYFSHDPQLKTNFDAVPLDIEKWSPDTEQSSESSTAEAARTTTSKSPKTKIEYEEPTEEQWEDIFNHIQNPDDRDVWIEVGLATKEHFGDAGYQRWADWSKQSSKWEKVNESEHRKKWVDDFKPTNIKGIAKLIYLARQGGFEWENTKGQKRTKDQQKTSADADHPAQEERRTSTGAKTETTATDSASGTTPNATTGSDAGQTTKGNFHIEKNKSGEDVYVPNHHNINEFFETRKFSIWYDTFTRQILTTMGQEDETVVEWSDDLTINLTMNFQSVKGMRRLSRNIVDDIIHMYSRQNPRNQLTDWLDSLQWDKTPRLDHWLSRYCGAEDNVYVREVARCWLLGAVTRGYQPGTQFDHVLIFEGAQGSGKSSAIRILSNGWFAELEGFTGKESAEVLAGGVWLVELSELDGMKKSDVESVKRFITTLTDRYRPAYGRHVISVPRTCVFAGSTNETSYLRDSTGNRRFWPVKCADIDLEQLRADRDVLIAEAVYRYKQGESLLMNEEARKIAVEAQEDRFQVDSWEDAIRGYIENKKDVSMADVLETGLQIENKSMWTKGTEMRVGNILKRLGWSKRRVREGGGRERVYRYHKDS
jgi:predicted P-loop ATPase